MEYTGRLRGQAVGRGGVKGKAPFKSEQGRLSVECAVSASAGFKRPRLARSRSSFLGEATAESGRSSKHSPHHRLQTECLSSSGAHINFSCKSHRCRNHASTKIEHESRMEAKRGKYGNGGRRRRAWLKGSRRENEQVRGTICGGKALKQEWLVVWW
ncbi:hypothetical protein BCV70DRAFT_78592 [Testicularia cyperi]|uniref:Uncharacterized protein n=1 Tax=Testicularia cyperi TaxID=1882483 RepID=A0A317XV40_9BASI|nr:hypothetical protein BCV70DRAFT_78592 [Testicularia cyperi]